MEPLTTTIAGAIEMSGIGRTTIYRLIKSGELKSVAVGRRRLIVVASLRALLGIAGEPAAPCREQ